jgi:Ser/Thr protein kinase RdoA (MazF antagonist)
VSTGPAPDFEGLTPRGQLGRLRLLALDALREYDLEVGRVSFAARAFNTVFRVDTAEHTYALRVSPNLRIHAAGCEALEAAWAAALRRDIGLAVPQVIRSRTGSEVVHAGRAGVPGTRSCVLFEWVRGRPLRQCMTVDLVRKVGALTAVVHEHGAAFAPGGAPGPPAGALVADRVLYWRADDRLDELGATYGSVLVEALARAQAAIDALWRNPPHRPDLLHGDVQPGNVIVSRGKVTLIDFQDLIWGFEIQDVVFALAALDHFDDAPALAEAFRSGYEEIRPWPDADPETVEALSAARHLNVLNFGLSMRKPGLETFVTRHADRVAEWMSGAAPG